jgi:hypothetical protein
MALWGNKDFPNSNQKPVFANTTTATSNSTINSTTANVVYGVVAGVSTSEQTTNAAKSPVPQHSGWVSVKVGTGPITSVSIADAGEGINAPGFIVLTDGSALGQGVGANISYTIANTQNTLEPYSTDPTLNGVATVTLVSGGSLYSNASAVTGVVSVSANITQPTLVFTLGGRAGRLQTETLVAMGTITLDNPTDNVFFSGV